MAQTNIDMRKVEDKTAALLADLKASHFAPPSLEFHDNLIGTLKAKIKDLDEQLKSYHETTERYLKSNANYGEDIAKRWRCKMNSGENEETFIFDSQAVEEERDLLTTWQKERSAQVVRDKFVDMLSREERSGDRITSATQRYTKALKDLDDLYRTLPSPSIEDVSKLDQAEGTARQAKTHLNQTLLDLRKNQTALAFLKKAMDSMTIAGEQMDQRFDFSAWQTGSAASLGDMMKSDPVALSQNYMNISSLYIEFARQYQPAIPEASQIFANGGQLFADLIFKDEYSSLSPQDVIENVTWAVKLATRRLFQQYHVQSERVEDDQLKMKSAEDELNNSEQDLQRMRRKAF